MTRCPLLLVWLFALLIAQPQPAHGPIAPPRLTFAPIYHMRYLP